MKRRRDRATYYKEYDASHKPQRKVKNAAYHAAHRADVLARSRARYAARRVADIERKRAYRQANQEHVRARDKSYYAAMPQEIRQARTKAFNAKYADKRRAWREKHKERLVKLAAKWTSDNMGLKRAATARRLAAKIRATPAWADLVAIQAIYQEAARLTCETGIEREIDHIVPLRSPLVCGLHVACNLQILTKTENRRKHNRLIAA